MSRYAAVVGLLLAAGPAGADPLKPNVLLIVADDLGIGDVGCYGCKDIPTPHLDAVAKAGVRFTAGYVSAPVCSPCRAGMMTGRYQTRFGHELNPPGADTDLLGLPLTERLFPQYLRDAGYATGHVGKWHLGNATFDGAKYAPYNRGFDTAVWFPGQKKLPPLRPHRNGKPEDAKEYVNDAMAREAAAFLTRHKDRPWFLYLPFIAPHEPLDVPDDWVKPFADLRPAKRPRLAALIASLDRSAGAVLAALKETGQDGRTLVVFLSDNGSYPQSGGSNGPFRGRKGSLFEGGVRVPFVLRWPGVLPAGKTFDRPVTALDLLPTALAAAGVAVKPEWKLDGVDLRPYLAGEKAGDPHEALFWRYGGQMAVRRGDWKLVRAAEEKKDQADPPARLFDLAADPAEAADLAAKHPDTVKALQAAYDAWAKDMVKPLWGAEDK